MTKRNTTVLIAALGLGLLSACAPQPVQQLAVHEVMFYGQASDHLGWVYGKLSSSTSSLNIGGKTQELRPGNPQDTLYTPDSLLVGGKAVYASRTTAQVPPVASVVQRDNQYDLSAAQSLSASYLLRGGQWYRLSGALTQGASIQTMPSPLDAQASIGNLSAPETAALARALAPQGTLVASVLPAVPEASFAVAPAPTQIQATALYLQPLAAITQVTTTPTPTASTTTSSSFRVVASGTNAAQSAAGVSVATTQAALESLWRMAYRQSNPPVAPLLGNQTAVGIFLGSRPTGGYSVQVSRVEPVGNTLMVYVTVQAPGKGKITTQAITNPWTLVSVSGQYDQVRVIDQNGNELK